MLLVAAGLKAQAVIAESAARSSPAYLRDASRWAAIAAECLLAGWLVSGIWKVWARRVSLALLTVLVSVAGWHLYRGDNDCGCFGNVAVHPAWTAAVDGVALIFIGWFGRALPSPSVRRTGLAPGPRPAPARALVALAIATSAIAVLLSLGFGHVTPEPWSASGLVCERPTYSFGEVGAAHASALQHEFVLRNTTRWPIKIVKRLTICGCTSAAPPANSVAPGESVTIPVKVDWSARDGAQTASVTLFTDAPKAGPLVLKVVARVTNPVTVWPRLLDFGDLQPGLSEEQFFDVSQSAERRSLYISSVRVSDPSVRVTRVDPGSVDGPLPGGPGRFAVQLLASRKAKSQRAVIEITTSANRTPSIVRVAARYKGAITTVPASLLFDFRDKDAAVQTAQVQVRVVPSRAAETLRAALEPANSQCPFQVERVSSDVPGTAAVATVCISCSAVRKGVAAATLRLRSGADDLSVPVVALGMDR